MYRICHRSPFTLYKRRACELPFFSTRQLSNNRNSNSSRASMLQQKQRELLAMIESHHEKNSSSLDSTQDGNLIVHNTNDSTSDTQQQRRQIQPTHLQEKRAQLFHDAGVMTKSLYRSCLRCIQLIRHGNEHDMADFDEREQQMLNRSKNQFDFHVSLSSFEPPVDRDNELSSRAMYYLAFAKESFHQEIDCLEQDPWRVDNVKRFLYLIRQGEERRKWLLHEYQFEDPYAEKWDEDKVLEWEEKAWKLVKETYDSNGWVYQKDDVIMGDDGIDAMDDDGIDWDETDDAEDRVKHSK